MRHSSSSRSSTLSSIRDANSDTITVTAAEREIDPAEANRMAVKPGRYVEIGVRDVGSGMTAAVAAQAFESFFTTKEFGVGSGLGLSQVYGFARQSADTCTIESNAGKGTTIRLYLPAARSPAGDPTCGRPVLRPA